jgi:uncharacterized protein (TIGR01777 family)
MQKLTLRNKILYMATVLITGGSGLVGTALSKLLMQKGYTVIIIGRKLPKEKSTSQNISYAIWDIENQTINTDVIKQADYIVHLAGAGVADKRWSEKRKKEIVESRTKSSALIVKALKEIPNKIKAVISASAIGWYGPDLLIPNPKPFAETDNADDSFLGETCHLWEESIEPLTVMGKRLLILRTGIVLSKNGGALTEFKKPVKLGVAAILGNGKQVLSWIHIDDLCRMYAEAIDNENMQGVYNAVAPNPVDNKTLTLELAKKMKGKFFVSIHVPTFVLKIMLGELSIEVLKSATVSATKIRNTGFQFLFPTIKSALKDLNTH